MGPDKVLSLEGECCGGAKLEKCVQRDHRVSQFVGNTEGGKKSKHPLHKLHDTVVIGGRGLQNIPGR